MSRRYRSGRDALRALDVDELRAIAERRLPRMVFEYLDGGAEDESTLRRNRSAFERGMVRELLRQGVCAQCDEECGLKTTNEWNEQYKLANSTGYILRPEKHYKVTCYPAAF